MTCLTPSNPDSIPFGESLDISDSLAKTSNGSLFLDGRSMKLDTLLSPPSPSPAAATIKEEEHRVGDTEFLLAQTEKSVMGIRKLWKEYRAQTSATKMTSRVREKFGEDLEYAMMDEMREAMDTTRRTPTFSRNTSSPRPRSWNPLKLSISTRIALAARSPAVPRSRSIPSKSIPTVSVASSPQLPINPNLADEDYDIPDEFEEDFFSTASTPTVPDL